MSLVFIDGFAGNDLATKWTSPGIASIASTDPIHGPYLNVTNAIAQNILPASAEDDLWVVGFYYRTTHLTLDGDGNLAVIQLCADGGTTIHVTMTIVSDGSIRVRRGTGAGTTLGTTATGLVNVDTWYHLALKVLLHDSAGTVDVELNGVNVLSLSSQDTKNGGTDAVFDSFTTKMGVGATQRLDDLYICTGADSGMAGFPNNDFLGICRVDPLFPDADATPEDWDLSTGSDSFALIDETTPDGDTTFISSDVPGAKTQVGLQDLADLDHVIYGIQVNTYAKKEDAGSALFRHAIDSDGNIANGTDKVLSESYDTYWDVFEADPDGGEAWTPAQVNASEALVEVRT